MKKFHDRKILHMDEEKRRYLAALMEDAIRNAPVPFPHVELTRLMRQINRLRQRTYKEKVTEIRMLLAGHKRKTPSVHKPWTVIYGRSRKGNKHK